MITEDFIMLIAFICVILSIGFMIFDMLIPLLVTLFIGGLFGFIYAFSDL